MALPLSMGTLKNKRAPLSSLENDSRRPTISADCAIKPGSNSQANGIARGQAQNYARIDPGCPGD
jgi:hypothetical protein